MSSPDLILHRGLFTTLDRSKPTASAVAIKDGVFTAVGHDPEVMAQFAPAPGAAGDFAIQIGRVPAPAS